MFRRFCAARRAATVICRAVILINATFLMAFTPQAPAAAEMTSGTVTEAAEDVVSDMGDERSQAVRQEPRALHPLLSIPSSLHSDARTRRVRAEGSVDARRSNQGGPDALNSTTDAPPLPVSASFEALNDNGAVTPPDIGAAVGPNHLMVATNSEIRIQSKDDGTEVRRLPLNRFWRSLSNPSAFNPKVLYDPYVGRFIFTAAANARSAGSSVLIAVSQTDNPDGRWNLFRIDVDPDDQLWADSPNVGFNRDWIVVTPNMFRVGNNEFARSNVYILTKDDVFIPPTSALAPPPFRLATDPTPAFVPATTYDPNSPWLYLVQAGTDPALLGGGTVGVLRVSAVHGTVGDERFDVGASSLDTGTTWQFAPPERQDFAPQAQRAERIQTNDARMQSVVYRNGSLWCAHTVFDTVVVGFAGWVPILRLVAQVQWLELDGADIDPWWVTIRQLGRVDDPIGSRFYAFPSIAVNRHNDVLLGFSRFSPGEFASAAYAFRSGSDPINLLRTDGVLKEGEAPYFSLRGGAFNRWGNYSAAAVDPTNDLDLWTTQEYAAGPERWGTWWGKIAPPQRIAFTRDVGGPWNLEIFAMDADGTNATRLTYDAAGDLDPAWSPDGTTIAFTRDNKIYTMRADGGDITRLNNSGHHPAWSPNGDKITFSVYIGIDVMNANGTNVTRVTTNNDTGTDSRDSYPIWLPGGTRISFGRESDSLSERAIYIVNVDGNDEPYRLDATLWGYTDHAWSPEFTRIVFPRYSGNGVNLYTVNADGSGGVIPLTDGENDWSPDWSPGDRIAFSSRRSGDRSREIYVRNADGSVASLTNNTVYDDQPDWQPR